MEIKAYFNILLKRWWIVLLSLGIATTATTIWTMREKPVYESQASFIIRPRSSLVVDSEFVRALDIVSRRVEINTTFAEVSSSRSIHNMAIEKLGLSSEKRKGLTVSGIVVGGANVLTITAQGYDPFVVRDFANAVGEETVAYVGSLYDIFELQSLDIATVPNHPVSPNLVFNLLIGSFLGLAIGCGAAFVIEYIQSPYSEPDQFNIIDRETGAYNKNFLLLRMTQEVHRAKRNNYPLTLVLIKIDLEGEDITTQQRREVMRVFKLMAEKTIRDDDIMARINNNTFAFLFPYMPNAIAEQECGGMQALANSVARDVLAPDDTYMFHTYSSATTFTGELLGDNLLDRATHSLHVNMVRPNEYVRVA